MSFLVRQIFGILSLFLGINRKATSMIAHLKGIITDKSSQYLVVDVQGVGYGVGICDERLYKKDQKVFLYIYAHWNQDAGPTLYGFDTSLSKKVFAQVLSCSGCGPKIGLALLSAFSASQFLQIIATADARSLSEVNGIGPKKAQMMIMQLKDKVAKLAPEDLHPAQHAGIHKIKQISAALAALHYKQSEIARAIDVLNKIDKIDTSSFDELLKQTLAVLARHL